MPGASQETLQQELVCCRQLCGAERATPLLSNPVSCPIPKLVSVACSQEPWLEVSSQGHLSCKRKLTFLNDISVVNNEISTEGPNIGGSQKLAAHVSSLMPSFIKILSCFIAGFLLVVSDTAHVPHFHPI